MSEATPSDKPLSSNGMLRGDMNWQQKLANDTHGIITIPNIAITPVGFGISMWGVTEAAQGNYLKGGGLFLLGSTADLVDGR